MLSSLLNEPLPGNGLFWSSVSGEVDKAGNAYPIPLRVLSFEDANAVKDPDRTGAAVDVYARTLAQGSEERMEEIRGRLKAKLSTVEKAGGEYLPEGGESRSEMPGESDYVEDRLDRDELYRQAAIEHLRTDKEVADWLNRGNAPIWASGAPFGRRHAKEARSPPVCLSLH